MLLPIFVILASITLTTASHADYGYYPKGSNPTLYDPSQDSIVQLDESTFNDTVFCNADENCPSYVIEFYSDWCGHCRSYASLYKNLAKDLKDWNKVVKMAAINCADPFNENTCKANGILFFPYLKYFPRNSSDTFYGVKLRPHQSIAEMRNQITQVIMQDYAINHFEDWPTFDVLGDISTYGELWSGASESVDNMAIIFEFDSSTFVGPQLLLDLTKYSDKLLARRCLKEHPLVDALHITDFPTLAVFRRGDRTPVLVVELRRLLLSEFEKFLQSTNEESKSSLFPISKNETDFCFENPEKCKPLYYVSETDMLKAMQYSLFQEVARNGGPLVGANLSALYSFVDILANNFPVVTLDTSNNDTELPLSNSVRAVSIFAHMRDYLDAHGLEKALSVDDWQAEFVRTEEEFKNPFPVSSDWDHCKGSMQQYRGYTCGLWTTFHALTVSAFKTGQNNLSFRPLPILQSIRDYVLSFFGCEHCRMHFQKMTTRTFKMEAQVRRPEDVFLYLWRAHNIVNARLRNRDTEDPKFLKYQFPPMFLCSDCQDSNGRLNDTQVQAYILEYYSRIQSVNATTTLL